MLCLCANQESIKNDQFRGHTLTTRHHRLTTADKSGSRSTHLPGVEKYCCPNSSAARRWNFRSALGSTILSISSKISRSAASRVSEHRDRDVGHARCPPAGFLHRPVLHHPPRLCDLLGCLGWLFGPDLGRALARFDGCPLIIRVALFGRGYKGSIDDLSARRQISRTAPPASSRSPFQSIFRRES